MKHYITISVSGQDNNTILLNQLGSFNSGRITIGRMDNNDIVLAYPTVSRNHAFLDIKEDTIEIVDAGSLNKLRFNGNVYDKIRLMDGMKIVIGADESSKGAVTIYYHIVREEMPSIIEPVLKPINKVNDNVNMNTNQYIIEPKAFKKKKSEFSNESNAVYFGRRILALMLDYLIWFFMWFGATMLVILLKLPTKAALGFAFCIAIAIGWMYYGIMESSEQQATIGKMVMGLKVVDRNGERLTFKKASQRFLAKILSTLILFIGFIPIFGKKQTLHNYITGCKIISRKIF